MKIDVRVDISEVRDLERAAVRSLERAPDEMKRILDRKATEERRTHRYKNRSGDLEASTLATDVIEVGDQRIVQLEAGEEYASFVDKRGLMGISDGAAEAEEEIDFFLDGEVETLAGM